MNLVSAMCPSCGAQIQIPPDQDRAFCSYCGNQIMVEAAIAYGKVKIEGIVKTQSADFVIEAGVLKEYHGTSADVVVPSEVLAIGGAFNHMRITSVTLPEGLQELCGRNSVSDEVAFESCRSLKQITIPGSVKKVGQWSFNECTSLEEVIFEEGVTHIGESSFLDCTSLKTVTIPTSVEYVGANAFSRCYDLSSVTVLGSDTVIYKDAFCDCPSLTTVNAPENVFKISTQPAFPHTPWQREQERKLNELKKNRRWDGVCEHCGGKFKGIVNKKCSKCGREKNY